MGHLDDFSRWPAQRFIETGYGAGRTLKEAAKVYPECISIELHPDRYAEAIEYFKDQPHVKIYHGNSPDILRQVIDPNISTLFWLDAHYVEADKEKILDHGLCPIMEELQIIKGLQWKNSYTILIDDWSTFRLHDCYHWPELKDMDAFMGKPHTRMPELPGCDVFTYHA